MVPLGLCLENVFPQTISNDRTSWLDRKEGITLFKDANQGTATAAMLNSLFRRVDWLQCSFHENCIGNKSMSLTWLSTKKEKQDSAKFARLPEQWAGWPTSQQTCCQHRRKAMTACTIIIIANFRVSQRIHHVSHVHVEVVNENGGKNDEPRAPFTRVGQRGWVCLDEVYPQGGGITPSNTSCRAHHRVRFRVSIPLVEKSKLTWCMKSWNKTERDLQQKRTC